MGGYIFIYNKFVTLGPDFTFGVGGMIQTIEFLFFEDIKKKINHIYINLITKLPSLKFWSCFTPWLEVVISKAKVWKVEVVYIR